MTADLFKKNVDLRIWVAEQIRKTRLSENDKNFAIQALDNFTPMLAALMAVVASPRGSGDQSKYTKVTEETLGECKCAIIKATGRLS